RDHINQPIIRSEMDIINFQLANRFNKHSIVWTIAGSYRRGEPQSGDIDILIESSSVIDMNFILNLIEDILPATLASGPTKFMGILRLSDKFLGHRVDIRLIDPESYPYALMYFTGSQQFNILMRNHAIQLGYTLNEYGLYPLDDSPAF